MGASDVSEDTFREVVRAMFNLSSDARIIIVRKSSDGALRRADPSSTVEVSVEVPEAEVPATQESIEAGLQDSAGIQAAASALDSRVTGAQASTGVTVLSPDTEDNNSLGGGQVAGLVVGLICLCALVAIVGIMVHRQSGHAAKGKAAARNPEGLMRNPVYEEAAVSPPPKEKPTAPPGDTSEV